MSDPAALLREAHATCPGGCGEKRLVQDGPWTNMVLCTWPCHAAIDRAIRAAFEAGQQHRQDTMNLIDSGLLAFNDEKPLPKWLPGERSGDA